MLPPVYKFTFEKTKYGWKDGSEHIVPPEASTSVQSPTLGDSQMPVTPVSRDMTPLSGIYGHLHSSLHTYTQTHTHMLKQSLKRHL